MIGLTMDYKSEICSIFYKKKIARDLGEYVGVNWHWRQENRVYSAMKPKRKHSNQGFRSENEVG